MIQEVSGDIILSKAEAIAHGVAPADHFNQGLALTLRERWPSMAKDFRHWCHQSHPKPGKAWIWSGPGPNGDVTRVICLLTQDESSNHGHLPGKAHIEHINHSLKDLRKLIEKEEIKSVALPRLATGVGGLDWSDVKPLIEHHLGDLHIPIYVYSEYHQGQAAKESRAKN
ncbi:MAG: macro domain-containing protein [Pirellulaceae bacterium]|nr:macro domain-containing protein [Pirellulaceae bacterium]